jgi:Ca2+-binding RTX toxin-like protein
VTLKRARTIGKSVVVVTAVVVASFVGTQRVLHVVRPRTQLIAGTSFTISSTISSSSSSPIAADLYPGVSRYLRYTVSNPLSVPITVTDIHIVTPVANAGACASSNLDLSHSAYTGTPALVVAAHSSNSIAEPLSLNETGADQDACQHVTFNFTYAGAAQYTEVYGTQTVVTSSQNPSNVGAAVTYTASTTASAASGQDAVPSSPTGTVTFKDNGVAISGCVNVPVLPFATTVGKATCTSPAYAGPATHPITAVYSNSDGNFTGSTSAVLNQIVQIPSVCSGSFNVIVGTPSTPTIKGTNANDFISAFGANYSVDGANGNDCLDAGDGNNALTDGNGNAVVLAGNGTNTVTLGNGTNKVIVGTGKNTITVGNLPNTIYTGGRTGTNVSSAPASAVTITAGNGNNTIYLGNGPNQVTVGNGTNVVYFGTGATTFNAGKKTNTCYVPAGSRSLDTITNCTVVLT